MTPDQKIEWLISSGGLVDFATYHESRELIRMTYPHTSTVARQRLIQAIRDATELSENDSQGTSDSDHDLYEWFDVLLRADPDCELAQTAFQELQTRHSEWEPQKNSDLLFHVSEGYRVRHISPWTIDELLSRPGGEWVDEVLGYEPQPLGSSIVGGRMDKKRAAKAVREAARREVNWGIDFANELVCREEWRQDIWQELIGSWRDSELEEHECVQVLTLLHSPKLLVMHSRSITDLLYSLVENGGKPYAIGVVPTAKTLASLVWDESEHDKPGILSETDWLTYALNSNAGMVVRFWLSALWVESEGGTNRSGHFREDDQEFFDLVIEDGGMRGKLGQAMLTTHLGYLLSFDYEWTTKRLLPLFEPEHDSFVPAWHGFTWGQSSPDVGELMKPMFLLAVENIHMFKHVGVPSRRNEFVRRYANMMIYIIDEPLIKWVPELFKNGDDEDRYTFACEIGRILENMADAQKIELWNRWLGQYWTNRLSGVPRPLERKEVEEMLRWPRDLQVVFDDAVELAISMPSEKLEVPAISEYIVDEELARSFPKGTAQLLEYLDSMETNSWDWDKVETVIDVLLASQLDDALKEKIRDIQVRRVASVVV